MKRHKLLSSMDLIDEKYLEEASPDKKKSGSPLRMKLGALAAIAAIMITSVSAWLFVPYSTTPPDVSAYQNSQYYPLIQKLNYLTFNKPTYRNRFELFVNSFNDIMFNSKEESATDVALNSSPSAPNYVETTDNQVSGIIEADLIKRSDSHIFYLRRNALSVYPINGKDTECISTYTIDIHDPNMYCYGVEMYLSPDCTTVYVIMPTFSEREEYTHIVSLDVTDPANITEKERVSVSGSYVSSRFTENKLMLVTNFSIVGTPDFSDESSFIPEITTSEGTTRPTMDNILCPDEPTNTSFAVVTMLDAQNMKLIGSVACLSYSYNIYASADSIYLTRGFTHSTENADGSRTETSMTEISRVAYSDDGLQIKGSVTVKGSVRDQYSLDEYNGVLRVAVTTRDFKQSKKYASDNETNEMVFINNGKTNASLYCLDKDTFEILAAVENFAPEGERIQSARFDGNTAYICTSLQLSDPVFFFDLSDLNNIIHKDTGTIDGFSTSLVNFGDGYLLGIGVGNTWNTVKIEVYAETESGVKSVCSKEIRDSSYSGVYKSYYIDRENSLLGLLICPNNGRAPEYYLLLHFDGAKLVTILELPLKGNYDTARAVLDNGFFYTFTDHDFKVTALK